MTSECPAYTARCSGAQPSLLASFTSAPKRTRILTSSRFPWRQLWCKAVWPSISRRFTLTFPSRSSRIRRSSAVFPLLTASRKVLWQGELGPAPWSPPAAVGGVGGGVSGDSGSEGGGEFDDDGEDDVEEGDDEGDDERGELDPAGRGGDWFWRCPSRTSAGESERWWWWRW